MLFRSLAQAADEEDQLPTVIALLIVRFSPARHAGQSYAISDNVSNLSVRQVLRLRQAQVRNFGVKVATDARFSGAVGAMAHSTAVEETFSRFLEDFRRGLPRIYLEAGPARDCQVTRGARYRFFQVGRLIRGAKTKPNQPDDIQGKHHGCHSADPNKKFPGLHRGSYLQPRSRWKHKFTDSSEIKFVTLDLATG